MKSLYSLLLLFAVLSATDTFSQAATITISGRVSSFEESLALEGATVQVKGTKNVTGTMADGTYTLVISKEDKTLVFSLSGYESKEVPVTKSTEYNVVLKRTGSSLALILEEAFAYKPNINLLYPVTTPSHSH